MKPQSEVKGKKSERLHRLNHEKLFWKSKFFLVLPESSDCLRNFAPFFWFPIPIYYPKWKIIISLWFDIRKFSWLHQKILIGIASRLDVHFVLWRRKNDAVFLPSLNPSIDLIHCLMNKNNLSSISFSVPVLFECLLITVIAVMMTWRTRKKKKIISSYLPTLRLSKIFLLSSLLTWLWYQHCRMITDNCDDIKTKV